MSSFDKTVKLACKPKAAPPKAKYLDPIIAATYSEDGAVHDVCKALSPRFREPNAIVVFKALIVLHTMIRNGATDNVLTYLASDDVLRLRNVSGGQWEGYNAPRNLQNYAAYLDSRIRTYKDLKHDPVRIQSDSNRDQRVENSLDQVRGTGGPQRSKTIAGRKLRMMTVEKGLLRETKAVQRTIQALLECRFYLDDLEDELNVTALRMLVKDLLVLFQALNEGVVNVLEHYFEMSRVDAEQALNIYRNFCKQTDKVVEYLGVAKKLQNLLNIPIPNLKHAPVSLASALEEYLKDPNFEQNRIEYKTNKALADKNPSEAAKSSSRSNDKQASSSSRAISPKPSTSTSSQATEKAVPKTENKALVDFFASIEEEQPAAVNAQPTGVFATPFQQPQPTAFNPFVQRQSMMMTGAFPQQPFAQPPVPQQSGFIQPQHTAFTGAQQSNFSPPQQSHHPPFSSFLQPQPTGFLQPQATGSNPFRQSMMLPQMTGFPAFGSSPFQTSGSPFNTTATPSTQPIPQSNAFSPVANGNGSANGINPSVGNGLSVPQRPSSTPITSNSAKSFGQAMQPVVTHQTGSRNPFGIPQEPAPPVPKAPTLQELATGAFGRGAMSPQVQPQQPQPSQPTSTFSGNSGSFSSTQPSAPENTSMANVASSFTFNNKWGLDLNKPGESQGAPSLASQPTSTSTFSSQPTGSTNATSAPSLPLSPIQPQTTGFSGIKPFKPTSSFGASLLESLPPIPQSGSSTASSPGLPPQQTGFGAFSSSSTIGNPTSTASPPAFGALNAQPTGFGALSTGLGSNSFSANLNGGLRPQTTGGAANPFRASMFGGSPAPFGNTSFGSTPAFPGAAALGSSLFNGNFGAANGAPAASDPSKPQQNGVASLI